MKKIIFLLLLIQQTIAQEINCADLGRYNDEITNELIINSSPIALDYVFKDGLYGDVSISIHRYGKNKYLQFYTDNSIGCVTSSKYDRSKAYVKLENGEILTFFHSGKTDCGNPSLFCKLTESEILKFKKSKIKYIKLIGTQYITESYVTRNEDFLINYLDCLK